MDIAEIKNNMVKMIMKFSIPSIIAMVLTSSVTIVDGLFIGNFVGEEALAAVNLGLPILYLYLGIGIMIGVGGIVIAGIALGSGNKEKSNNVFNQTYMTAIIGSILLSILMFILLKPIGNYLNIDDTVFEYFYKYYLIMLFVYPIMILNSCFGMFIRGEGKPEYFMFINVVMVFSNIILDYVFVKILDKGIIGIALASLVSVLIGLALIVSFFTKKSEVYKFKRFNYSKEVFKNTILNGGSEFIGQIAMSISMGLYNYVIMREAGINGLAAFAIVGYVAYIYSMVVLGFGQGVSPLISYSYGAEEVDTSKKLRKTTSRFVLIFGILLIVIVFLGVDSYSKVFVKNKDVEKLVRQGLLIFSSSFIFSGTNTINSFYFTSIGKAKESVIISVSKGLIVLIACIIILPKFFGMTGIWLAAPVTEAITMLICLWFLSRE